MCALVLGCGVWGGGVWGTTLVGMVRNKYFSMCGQPLSGGGGGGVGFFFLIFF
jgi:hypothetical protein